MLAQGGGGGGGGGASYNYFCSCFEPSGLIELLCSAPLNFDKHGEKES